MPTYRDRALLVEDSLVLSDLHLGKGASSSIELPVGDGADVVARVESLVAEHEPDEVVIAGDLLHSYGTIPLTVEDAATDLFEIVEDAGAHAVVTPGNHDPMLESVWPGEVEKEYRIGDTVVCHGHEAPDADAERYVVGHDHPTVEIEGRRQPCFLVGDGVYRSADVIVLPAFNRLLRGVKVNEMTAVDFQTPLVSDADAFRPIVWDEAGEEPLTFPPLGEFRQLL